MRHLTWLALPVALWGLLARSASVTSPWQVAEPPSCPTQRPASWLNVTGEVVEEDQFILGASGTVYRQVCQPGILTFRARGSVAQNLFPLMSVGLGGQTLLTTRVSGERSYRVVVPRAGLLTLTFHNDAYLPDANPPEDRNLFVSKLRFIPTP